MSYPYQQDIMQYQFKDLIDVTAFSQMLDHFFVATKIPNGVIANNGEVISETGWETACAKFHRVHPETQKLCIESNIELMQEAHVGHSCGKLCANGLLDYATPIEIEGHQIATLFLGQVLHTPPDLDFFRAQAKKYGFDEAEYIASIKEIPVIDKTEIDALMNCMVDMAKMLALSGLARLRQTKMEKDISKHKERQIQLEDILDSSPVAIGWSHNKSGKIEYVNRAFQHLFGYTLDDIPNLETWYKKAYPDVEYRENVIFRWYKNVDLARQTRTPPPVLEANVTCKNGHTRRVLLHVSWVGERRLVNFSDIHDHWLTEQRLRAHDKMLEMVASGTELTKILNTIVKQIQLEDSSCICSILLTDESGKYLIHGAAPDLPAFYNEAINGIEVGLGVGSCGSAVYLRERVIVEDIMTHPYWQLYTELAKKAGLYSCWSEPIMSTTGEVLGTFGIYHGTPAKPTDKDIERISFAANLAAVAIENRHAHDELKHQAYYDYLTGLANRRFFLEKAENELNRTSRYGTHLSILMLDLDHFKKINDTYGHRVGDIVLKKLAETCLKSLRSVDLIGRLGGEEFAILLPETDSVQALDVAERLCSDIESIRVPVSNDEPIQFSASIGITTFTGDCSNIDCLLNQADEALYIAKNNGRNQVSVYQHTLYQA